MERVTARPLGPIDARTEYTSRRNIGAGRHGWLRLQPAYSVQLVDEILSRYDSHAKVCDPFGGSGTTALSAAAEGHECVSVEINPFLVWLGRAKVAKYSRRIVEEALKAAERVSVIARARGADRAAAPRLASLDRWWQPEELAHLQRIKAALDRMTANGPTRDLLLIAFCRTLIESARVTRRHQSLSYAPAGQLGFSFEASDFVIDVARVTAGVAPNPKGHAQILEGDARTLEDVESASIDVVVTSPPYPNRLTPLRELRPYMYWLGYISEPTDCGELDWRAIGGTWGAATSRLSRWKPEENGYTPSVVRSVCEKIRRERATSAALMATYVCRYFGDIVTHLTQMKRVVRRRGRVHYIVGNSSFYGHVVETEKAFADILQSLGFRDVAVYTLRKRSSKAALYEYVVSAQRP